MGDKSNRVFFLNLIFTEFKDIIFLFAVSISENGVYL